MWLHFMQRAGTYTLHAERDSSCCCPEQCRSLGDPVRALRPCSTDSSFPELVHELHQDKGANPYWVCVESQWARLVQNLPGTATSTSLEFKPMQQSLLKSWVFLKHFWKNGHFFKHFCPPVIERKPAAFSMSLARRRIQQALLVWREGWEKKEQLVHASAYNTTFYAASSWYGRGESSALTLLATKTRSLCFAAIFMLTPPDHPSSQQ